MTTSHLRLLTVFILMIPFAISAQDLNFNKEIRKRIEQKEKRDRDTVQNKVDTLTIIADSLSSPTLEKEKEPTVEIITLPPKIKSEPLRMSNEALYWSRYWVNENPLFEKGEIIVNPLFMPTVYKKENIVEQSQLFSFEPIPLREVIDTAFFQLYPTYHPENIFESYEQQAAIQQIAYRHLRRNRPGLFHITIDNLPVETTQQISNRLDVHLPVDKTETNPSDLNAPTKFLPDRIYWISSFEGALKFSQNHVSPNWHKGGVSNLNVFTKERFTYNYAKDKIQLKNLFEFNLSVYNAPKDTLREYKIGDDLLRFYSNLGIKAFSHWNYTLDAELKTQIFTHYEDNTELKQSAFLSPFTVNLGVGMKYDYARKFSRKDRAFTISLNMAPLSYSFMYSNNREIALGRHGFPKIEGTNDYEHKYSKMGSTIRLNMTIKPNRNVFYKLRFDYFSSYDRVVCEVENSLDLSFSRYFSTLLYIHVRFDDGVTKLNDYDSFFQINELLSFGLSYKW